MTEQNRLQKFKLTKPDMFSIQFNDAYKEYKDWLDNTNNPQRILRKQHKWHTNLSDYFNYGFNECTLKMYVNKITQLAEIYRDNRKSYAEKCQKSEDSIFTNATEIKKLAKDFYPLDLGGLFLPVDSNLNFGATFELKNLYEYKNNLYSSVKTFQDQYHCTGEALLFKSKFMTEIFQKQVKYIESLYSQYQKQKDLYLLNDAIKVFPQTQNDQFSLIQQQLQKFNLNSIDPSILLSIIPASRMDTKISTRSSERSEKKKTKKRSKSRSRTPKKKKNKKHH